MKKKICLVGDFSVGKTSLAQQYVNKVFSEKYLTTVGVKIDTKEITIDEKTLKMVVWDVAGRDSLSPLNANYLIGASGFLLVLDGTRKDTLQSAQTLVDTVVDKVGEIPFVVLVNKNDLQDKWLFNDNYRTKFAALEWQVMTSSARTGENVEQAFQALAERILGKTPLSSNNDVTS